MTPRQSAILDNAEEDFQEFIALARNGITAAADDAEHAAWRLAQAVINDAQCLTKEALRGFSVFTAIAFQDSVVAANLIETDTMISDE